MPLAIVPLGTGNLLAATLGIPRNPMAAAERLATASPVTIDTGLLNCWMSRERFAVAAGLGFDARVMSATSSAAKARFGVLAYFATVLRLVASLPVAQTEIVVDGRTFEMPTVAVLVANCGQIVPGLLGPRVTLDPSDGVLDVIAIRGGAALTKVPIAAAPRCTRCSAATPATAATRCDCVASASASEPVHPSRSRLTATCSPTRAASSSRRSSRGR